MGMADVPCAKCGHLMMARHKMVNSENSVCMDCGCQLGPARRDDLLDKISDLEERILSQSEELVAANVSVEAYEEALDNIRIALGQESTHYLVMANDVTNLKKKYDEAISKIADLQHFHDGIVANAPKCGACAEGLFTGVILNSHDDDCPISRLRKLEKKTNDT